MTTAETAYADNVLKDMLANSHTITDFDMARIGFPQDWRKRVLVCRYLQRLDLIVEEQPEMMDHWDDDGGERQTPTDTYSLTPDGIEAATVGLQKFLQLRKERQDMHFRADRAVARGYRISLWGIVFLIVGIVTSGANLYIFYRQVFDPPPASTPIVVPPPAEQKVEQPKEEAQAIDGPHDAPKDTLALGPALGGRKGEQVTDTVKRGAKVLK